MLSRSTGCVSRRVGSVWRTPARFSGSTTTSVAVPPVLATGTGVCAGAIGGLCGVGGGVFVIPMLRRSTSLTAQQITATSLFSITLGAATGSLQFLSAGLADVDVAAVVSVFSVCGAVLGARLNPLIPGKYLLRGLATWKILAIPIVITGGTGLVMSSEDDTPAAAAVVASEAAAAAAAPSTPTNPGAEDAGSDASTTVVLAPSQSLPDRLSTILSNRPELGMYGFLAGLTSGLGGVGGGIAMTTLLGLTMPQAEAVAVSLCAMLPTAVAGSVINSMNGNVMFRAGALISVGSAVGMLITTRYVTPYTDDKYLRYLFGGLLGLSAVALLM